MLIVVVGGAIYWKMVADRRAEEQGAPSDVFPAGHWRRDPNAPWTTEGDLERVLSLPYLQGKVKAGQVMGVVQHDPELAQAGLNLYCSGHSPEAVLMDMDGKILHRWRLRFATAFPDQQPDNGSLYFRRVALAENGDLTVLFHGWGLARIDRDSNLLWSVPLAVFNDFFITEDDHILAVHKRAATLPEINPEAPVLEDFIVELSPTGEEIGRWSLLRLLRESEHANLLASMSDEGDILHGNTVTLLSTSPFEDGVFQPHRMLFSVREVDTIGVLDPESQRVVWAASGGWRRQHEPVLLESGRVLLFDNKGRADGMARVLEFDPETGDIAWSWGDTEEQRMYSPEGGSVARLANGNTLITASESGRALEVTPDGTIAWEFFTPHRAGPNNELVAALWEVLRLDPERVSWLAADER